MAYPDFMEAYLVSVNNGSCGTLKHRLELDSNASPPEYREVAGRGDFDYVRCWPVDLGGGQHTWNMDIWYTGTTTACTGYHRFRRKTDADDPRGDYCQWDGSNKDCDAAEANNIEVS